MKTRKIVLLVSILLLSIVLVLQLIFSGGSKIRYINLKEAPSEVTIEKNGSETIKVTKKDDLYILQDVLNADTAYASSIFSEIQYLKIIDTVANSVTEEGELERYGLNPQSLITVSAKKDGKVLRTIRIGKEAASGSQTYAQLDNSKDVVLVSGSLRSYYDKTLEDLIKAEEEVSDETLVPDKGILDVNTVAQ